MKHRFLSMFLAICLCISMVPAITIETRAADFDTSGWLWPVKATNAPTWASNKQIYCKTMYRAYYSGHAALDISDYTGYTYAIRAAKSGTVTSAFTGCINYNGAAEGGSGCTNCSPNYSSKVTYEGKVFCGYGNGVIIDHGNGTSSEYGHLSSVVVSYGSWVNQGDIIGYMGSTGASTGPHLHFAIKHNGVFVNNNPIGDVELKTNLWNGVDTILYADETDSLYADIGTDFTAVILNTASWKPIENCYYEGNYPPVRLSQENGFANQLWYFTRQSDGSYKIASCYDGKYLDVRDANTGPNAVIQTCGDSGSDAQKWYLIDVNGSYALKSKLSGYVIDLVNNDTTTGNTLQTYSYNGSGAQIWSFYRGDECKLSGPTLSVTPGTDSSDTVFTWNNVYGESHYVLKIWENTAWDGEPDYYEITVETGCKITLPAGTYQAYVDAVNHFEYKMDNVVTFTVKSGCTHTYSDWETTTPATCTTSGVKTRSCTKGCGHSETQTIAATGHDFSPWIEVLAATCTADGVERKTCRNNCGTIEDRTVSATGHDWEVTGTSPANCQHTAGTSYTCANCGVGRVEREEMVYSDWVTEYPESAIEGFIQTKTQYRYRDRLSNWSDPAQRTIDYVASWPYGFDTYNSYYAAYNKTPVTAYENDTEKVTVQSNDVVGYLYYHWCRNYTGGPINRRISDCYTDTYWLFHCFYSTENAGDYDSAGAYGEGSKYFYNADCCRDSWWYLQIPVYRQTYTTQTKVQSGENWTDWSSWSDTEVSATDNRQVETRTVYRYVTNLGEHTYTDSDKTNCIVCTNFRVDEDEGAGSSPSLDFNRDGKETEADAVYLLWYTLFNDLYPLGIEGDLDGNETVNSADAMLLLWHLLFPESYPL